MKRVLIDTNIYIEAMFGNPEIVQKLQKVDMIGLSAISIGELLAGFKIREKQSEQVSQFEEFLDSPRVELCSVTYSTADFYSEIYLKLRKAGTPIPTNDIWIAATALEHGFRIFTIDKHFQNIVGLAFY
ncbi:type II toxin-antitoxin system VapC family toxin [candidate division KSB1 bacterium]|nr:type II toxin-antitoxin system VapC family toxin [candidate division KSB1 bacterium]TDI91636.1 MAG: type II toxin-antitoxin system VapC family toxin [Caldithrix sp.]TDJ00223.1 MAG: type II toxin-antitoxin system VapC family toxin [Caldithrix sp.]